MTKYVQATAVLVIAACGILVAACVDVTPLTAPASDAGVDVVVSTSVAASTCYACTTGADEPGPSCRAEYETCKGDPKCLSLFLCGIPRGCYAPGQDLVACLSACGAAAGLSGIDDPSVTPFLALYGCATTTCGAGCGATSNADASAAKAHCSAPLGTTCPPSAGNCKGIGAPCTKGGGQCAAVHAVCDVDLDPRGAGMCITLLACKGGDCGSGATCCKTSTTQNIPMCMPNQCLPADCQADP